MKKLLLLFIIVLQASAIVFQASGQIPRGRVIVERVNSVSLKNSGGENPTRRVKVYLPGLRCQLYVWLPTLSRIATGS